MRYSHWILGQQEYVDWESRIIGANHVLGHFQFEVVVLYTMDGMDLGCVHGPAGLSRLVEPNCLILRPSFLVYVPENYYQVQPMSKAFCLL